MGHKYRSLYDELGVLAFPTTLAITVIISGDIWVIMIYQSRYGSYILNWVNRMPKRLLIISCIVGYAHHYKMHMFINSFFGNLLKYHQNSIKDTQHLRNITTAFFVIYSNGYLVVRSDTVTLT